MPNTHETLTSLFDDIADAIRDGTGDSSPIVADDFPDAIGQIGRLPVVTSADNDKVLKVIDGAWAVGSTITYKEV